MENHTQLSQSDKLALGILVVIILAVLGGMVFYLNSNPSEKKLQEKITLQQAQIEMLTSQKNSLTQTNASLQAQVTQLQRQGIYNSTYPTATPFYDSTYYSPVPTPKLFDSASSHQYDSGGSLRITGVYELNNSVVYTTNTPAYSTFLTWIQPSSKTQSFMVRGSRFDSTDRTTLTPGFGYQIKVYLTENAPVLSQEFFFSGNRTLIDDSRCPAYVSVTTKKPVCRAGQSCITDASFVREYCPLVPTR